MGRIAEFIRDLRIQSYGIPTQLNGWLSKLPTVQWQAFISAVLAIGTAAVYWVTMLKEINVDSVNFGMWLGFVAAYGGITYMKTFAKKRDTYDPLNKPSEQNTSDSPSSSTAGETAEAGGNAK